MAQKPSKASGKLISNIMEQTRGIFNFGKSATEEVVTPEYGTGELISRSLKSKILTDTLTQTNRRTNSKDVPANSIFMAMGATYSKVAQERLENRRILQLMPDVAKAARLTVASIFSPNDLSRKEIGFQFDIEGVSEEVQTKLAEVAAKFFQRQLKLRTAAPSWVYQFGYETGASVFAIVPLQTLVKVADEAYLATESFNQKVLDPIAHDSLFGFGDRESFLTDFKEEAAGLESFGSNLLKEVATQAKVDILDENTKVFSKSLIDAFIGHEALSLTDNPAILQSEEEVKKRRRRKTASALKRRWKHAVHDPVLELSTPDDKDVEGNPILFRLPPESVTVIHTPGAPSDHQGYLILLDINGNPVNVVTQEADEKEAANNFANNRSNLFSQIQQAYGMGNNTRSAMDRQTMEHVYNRVVGRHLQNRLSKAGYGRVEIPNMDATLRCMFTRLLQEKRTRVLFLPKDLVTYMTFEYDQYGYGVSKLNGIKFSLGLKMAVRISRILAGIKAAMDNRKLTLKVDENMMEQPEQMIQMLIQQYIQKNTMSFSTDPGFIQSQIAEKSFNIKTEGVPGLDNFDITNEPGEKSGAQDFDPAMAEQLDKDIINGMDVPASTMNSLNEDEYARSVTTTNLFFAMEISIKQDTVIEQVTDVLRKYARYSKEFHDEIYKVLPELKGRSIKSSNMSTDESTNDDKSDSLPANCTLGSIIDAMSISLPKPSIAPSKAQFESLEAMATAITNLMSSLFPDELAGKNDALRPVVALLRSRLASVNIRAYLNNVGMSNIEIPSEDMAPHLKGLSELQSALLNVSAMMDDKLKLVTPTEPTDSTSVAGY